MEIRKTVEGDIPRLMEIYAEARDFMASSGNPGQWEPGYPSESVVLSDIAKGWSHVVIGDDGRVVGTFCLMTTPEPSYAEIYDGEWLDDTTPYVTLHRVASDGTGRGVFSAAVKFALRHCPNLRCDTGVKNLPMQRALAREGFRYCGIVHLPAPKGIRQAYQLLNPA